MNKVYNKYHKNAPVDAVYVGRPTVWGNPYTHIRSATTEAKYFVQSREEAVEAFREYLLADAELTGLVKLHLKGKDLICWCAPAACHADVLLEIANS